MRNARRNDTRRHSTHQRMITVPPERRNRHAGQHRKHVLQSSSIDEFCAQRYPNKIYPLSHTYCASQRSRIKDISSVPFQRCEVKLSFPVAQPRGTSQLPSPHSDSMAHPLPAHGGWHQKVYKTMAAALGSALQRKCMEMTCKTDCHQNWCHQN
jgi:hypothetical protein